MAVSDDLGSEGDDEGQMSSAEDTGEEHEEEEKQDLSNQISQVRITFTLLLLLTMFNDF